MLILNGGRYINNRVKLAEIGFGYEKQAAILTKE